MSAGVTLGQSLPEPANCASACCKKSKEDTMLRSNRRSEILRRERLAERQALEQFLELAGRLRVQALDAARLMMDLPQSDYRDRVADELRGFSRLLDREMSAACTGLRG